jgi:hypothetical protein
MQVAEAAEVSQLRPYCDSLTAGLVRVSFQKPSFIGAHHEDNGYALVFSRDFVSISGLAQVQSST